MNDVAWFVAKLRTLGFRLRVDPVNHPGLLGITRPPGFVDATLDSVIAEYRERIVAYLESEQSPTDSHPTDDWVEEQHADGTTTWCRPDHVGKGPIWPDEPPSRPVRQWRRLVGAGHPPCPRPVVPPDIVATPVVICARCNRERVVAGCPGALASICFYCATNQRN